MRVPGSPALFTDLYELTMSAAYLDQGMAERPATFSLFVRTLPPERGFLVAAGLDDVLAHLEDFRFSDDDLATLRSLDLFDDTFLDFLSDLRFDGQVRAVPEGTPVFPHEPVLEVDAPLLVAQIVETYALNQITTQTTLASKAARVRLAARDRAVLDFGLRRAQGLDAGMKLARACRIVGIAGTSNVTGSAEYGLRAAGTMAHSFVQAYEDEVEAFRAFAALYGDDTILLVDTYDTVRGLQRAIEVAAEMRERGTELRGVRLDSGDLAALSRRARAMLDDASFPDAQVFASGGLDEYRIDELLEAGAPIDGFGVGSALAVSSDVPVLDSVYKLVEYDGRPVRKTSEGKVIWPGRKQVWRHHDGSGDLLATVDEEGPPDADPLLVEMMRRGVRTEAGRGLLSAATERFEAELARLPGGLRSLRDPDSYPVEIGPELRALVERLDMHGA